MAISVNFSGNTLSGNIPLTTTFTNYSTGYNQVVPSGVGLPINNAWVSPSIDNYGRWSIACLYGSTSGFIYTSSDYQKTWVKQTTPGGGTGKAWNSVVVSPVNGVMLGCYGDTFGYIWYSRDYGSGWFVSDSPSYNWKCLCVSNSGNFAAVGRDGSYIWTSNNSGVNWVEQSGSPSKYWWDMSCSADGSVIVAASISDYIYISKDYGVTWSGCTELGNVGGAGPKCVVYGGIGDYKAFVYMGTTDYIKKFDSSTNSWSNVTTLPKLEYYSMTMSRSYPVSIYNPPAIVLCYDNNMYVTSDYGITYDTYGVSLRTKNLSVTDRVNFAEPGQTWAGYYKILSSNWTSSSSICHINSCLSHFHYWQFGDGYVSYNYPSIAHTYTTRNNYTVSLGIDSTNDGTNILTRSGYINTCRNHTVNISGGLIKSWTYIDGSGILPLTPNTHSINISGGLIKSWGITTSGTRTPHNHSVVMNSGLVKDWTIS